MAVQADGKVLVAGTPEESEGFSVARLLSNGSPDPSWGEGGVVTTHLGKFASAFDVAVQPDGKIVVVGEAPGAKNEDFAIVRYLSNGELDPSFGEGGIVILPVGEFGDQGRVVALGPGGRIAVVGISDLASFRGAVGVAMLESNGTPEAAFAGDGTTLIQTESGEDDRGEGVDFQADGKIVIADSTGAGIGDGFTLIRLGLDGKPDASFGSEGIVETPIPGEGGVEEGRISDVARPARRQDRRRWLRGRQRRRDDGNGDQIRARSLPIQRRTRPELRQRRVCAACGCRAITASAANWR